MKKSSRRATRSISRVSKLLLLVTLTLAPLAIQAQVVDPIVTSNGDSGAGTLRQAIADATAGSTITFDASLSGQTIVLTSGELDVDKELTIDASSLDEPVTISGDGDENQMPSASDSRVFHISNGGMSVFTFVLDGVVVDRGYDPNEGGCGITVDRVIATIRNCTISNCKGGIISGNGEGRSGGGIFHNQQTLTIVNSTIVGNEAGDGVGDTSGAIAGGDGGGIYSNSTLKLINSTVAQNSTGDATNNGAGNEFGGDGGGIFSQGGSITVQSSTILQNTTGSGSNQNGRGGGIFLPSGTTLHLNNSIVAENTASSGNDLHGAFGTVTETGNNLVGDNETVDTEFPVGEPNGSGDLAGTELAPLSPWLQPLADNGGRTQTFMPYFDSNVVNAGSTADLPADETDVNWNLDLGEPLPLDQTGNSRVSGSQTDIGAVEYQFPATGMEPLEDPTKAFLQAKINKLKKKIKKLTKKGKKAKAQKLKKKLKKLQKSLATLG